MHIPDIFKYSSLVSVPLFTLVTCFLLRKTNDYSPHKQTISHLIEYLPNPTHNAIFRINFLVKAILDFCFALYLLGFFSIAFSSVIAILLFASALLFGSLAYFVEATHRLEHKIIVYTSGVLWAIGQILIVLQMRNNFFLLFSIIAILLPLLIGFTFLFLKKTNVVVQVICVVIWYIWLTVFVFRFL